MTEKLLRIEEASERLGWKPATIRAKILRREIEYCKMGRSVRISETVIAKLIAQNTIPVRRGVRA